MKAKVIVLLGVLGVSFSSIFVKYATAPSAVMAFYRMFFSFLFLVPVILVRHREELKNISGKNLLLCLASGFFLACHFAFYFESLSHTSVASSTVLVDTEVFFVCIFSWILFRETCGRKGLAGILITFGGSVVLALADRSAGGNALFGDFLAFFGAGFVAVYTMIGARMRREVSTTLYTFLVYGMASVTLCAANLAMGQKLYGYDPVNYLLGLLLCLFCTFLGHSVFSWGLKYLPAALISNVKLGEPVFATVLAFFLFGQVPSWLQVLGGVLVLAGIYIYLSAAQGAQESRS